ncbi:hypothetical protein AAG906_003973 [Vitis piasezkii]
MAGDDEQPPLPPPKREMNSPFFLGTGDRPGDFITPTRLRGDNYDDWASDIQLALEARRKFEFLEGTITEQWKALAGLIGNAQVPDDRLNGKFDTKSWIIDTGATHHVTGDLSWLFDTIALFECPVGLPNGESCCCDPIRFRSFDHTRELIGTRVRRDGLYYFGGAEGDSVQHVSVHNATSTLELWHKRMGHPSKKVVKLLPPELFVSRDVNFLRMFFRLVTRVFVTIIPENIVPTVNVEIDSDFADFVDDDADLPNPQAQTQNPNLIQLNPKPTKDGRPTPRLLDASFTWAKLFPLLGLIHLGLTIQAIGDLLLWERE